MSLRQLKFKPKLQPNISKPRDSNKDEQPNAISKEENKTRNDVCTNPVPSAKNLIDNVLERPIPNELLHSETNNTVKPLNKKINDFQLPKSKKINEQPLRSEQNHAPPLNETKGVSLRQLEFKPKLQPNDGHNNVQRDPNQDKKALCKKKTIDTIDIESSPPKNLCNGISLRQLKFKPKLQPNLGNKALCDKIPSPIETNDIESPPSKKLCTGEPIVNSIISRTHSGTVSTQMSDCATLSNKSSFLEIPTENINDTRVVDGVLSSERNFTPVKFKILPKLKKVIPSFTNHSRETLSTDSNNLEVNQNNKSSYLLSLGIVESVKNDNRATNISEETNNKLNHISLKENSLIVTNEEKVLPTLLKTNQEAKKPLPQLFKLRPVPQLCDQKRAVRSTESETCNDSCAKKEDHSEKRGIELPSPTSSSTPECLNLSIADAEDTNHVSNKVKSTITELNNDFTIHKKKKNKKKKKKKKNKEKAIPYGKIKLSTGHILRTYKPIEYSIFPANKPTKKHKSMDHKSIAIFGSKSIRACHQKAPFKPQLTDRSNRALSSSTYGKMCTEAKEQFEKKFKDKVPDSSKLTMMDLIIYNPSSNPMPQDTNIAIEEIANSPSEQNGTTDKEQNNENENSSNNAVVEESGENNDTSDVPVPQLKLSADGKIVIAQESLVIKQSLGEISADITYETENDVRFRKPRVSRSRLGWSHEDTLKFYKALHSIGADFETMKTVFPNRTRENLKSKFKKEEKYNRALIDKVMFHHAEFNIDQIKEEMELNKSMERVKKPIKPLKPKLCQNITSEEHTDLLGYCRRRNKKQDSVPSKKEDSLSIKEIAKLLNDEETETNEANEENTETNLTPSSRCVRTQKLATQCLDDILNAMKFKNMSLNAKKDLQADNDNSNDHIVISTNIEYENMKYTKYISYNSNNLENPLEINETITHE